MAVAALRQRAWRPLRPGRGPDIVEGQATERTDPRAAGRYRGAARGRAIDLPSVVLGAAGQGFPFTVEFPCSPAPAAPASEGAYSQADRSVGLEEAPNELVDVLPIERPGT